MKQLTGHDFKEYFNKLSDDELNLRVLFDTEAKDYKYHMAGIEIITCETATDAGENLAHIGLHESANSIPSALKIAALFKESQDQLTTANKRTEVLEEALNFVDCNICDANLSIVISEALAKSEELKKGK